MATIEQIVHDIEFPRIPTLAGTPEEERLIELWRWGILTQIYSRIATNNFQFNVPEIQSDVAEIWQKALEYVETQKGGNAEIIELFPFMLNHALERIARSMPEVLDRTIEMTEEERAQIEHWTQRGVYYTLWRKYDDRTPPTDALQRVRIWIEGKITRDFSSEALQDMRFLIAVALQAFKSIIDGTLIMKVIQPVEAEE